VIAPSLTPGGIHTHIRCLAQGAGQHGASVTVVSGTREDRSLNLPGVSNERLDLLTRTGVRGVQGRIRQSGGVLLIHTPETYHLTGLLVEAGAAAVGVHGTPGTIANWLGGYRHAIAAASIQALPHLPLLVPGERYRTGVADEFAVPVDRVQALPNAIDTLIEPASSAGAAGILLPCRLANDKVWLLDAAIDLAEESSQPLRVVGSGLHADEWRDRLAGRCTGTWTLTETSELAAHIAEADVVVAAGLVAMEAAAAGRRVVVPSKNGGWLGAVMPSTLAQMREANFVTWGSAPFTDAGAVWAAASDLSDSDLVELSAAVREECSPAVMYGRLRSLLQAPGTPDPVPGAIAVLETIAESERDQQKVHADYATVLEAKDYFKQQATNWENAYREVRPQADSDESPPGPEPATTWRDRLSGVAARAYASRRLPVHTLAAGAYFAKKEAPARLRAGRRPGSRATVRRSTSIPALAWLAQRDGDTWECVIGPRVESLPGGFYEGVWDSDFGHFPPSDSEFAFGTGLHHAAKQPLFLSSRNPALYTFVLRRRHDGQVFVSNSLTFALTAAEVPADGPFVAHLSRSLRTTIQAQTSIGVYKAPTLLHEDDHYRLDAVTFFDFHVGDGGVITRRWRRPRKYFSDFATYREFMESTLRRLLDNAQSPQRGVALHPFVLLSSGYDSVAAAVLGKAAGLQDAGTLAVTVEGRDDSGLHVARALDLHCSVQEHVIGQEVAGLDFNAVGPLRDRALEFLTEGGVGLDLMMLPFADQLQSAVVLTGNYGDIYFERSAKPPSGFERFAFGGPPPAEFRLRTGFVILPVPLLGVRFTPPITDLNRSAEMAPFSTGDDYDRPVMRRIGEEAGLQRSDFGTAKTATAPQLLNAGEAYVEAISAMSERYRGWRD